METINETGLKVYLASKGFPIGMQQAVYKSLQKIPIRYFVVDNSGSMSAGDGHRLIGSGAAAKYVGCTRWGELVESVKFLAGLAHESNALSEFRLLNDNPPFLVGGGDGGIGYRGLLSALETSPSGGTPLCHHIREITKQLYGMESSLRAAGHKAMVIVATDGESSDGDLAAALKPLEKLPVQIVIRLCTDEDKVVEYWNNIDHQIEADIDVLDDLVGEAGEIHQHNPCITYGEPMHRMREFGINIKEFDLIDQSRLNLEQLRVVCGTIFGTAISEIPHPEADKTAFLKYIERMNASTPRVYSPLRKTVRPWIEESVLQSQYYGSGCSIS